MSENDEILNSIPQEETQEPVSQEELSDTVSQEEVPAKTTEKKKLSKPQQLWKDVREILVILAVFMLVYVLFFRVVVVDGGSMNETLIDGDRLVLISSLFYRQPQQGDIIVASKPAFRDGECIIKRVIATEGQWIKIEEGKVFVGDSCENEKDVVWIELSEPYITSATTVASGVSYPLRVPENCVFVMGDNRINSLDSRSPQIGLIQESEILGKAIFLIFPGTAEGTEPFELNRIGLVG